MHRPNILREVLPAFLLNIRRYILRKRSQTRNRQLQLAEVFSDIYARKLWGGEVELFNSGSGSSGQPADLYCDYLKKFIETHEIDSVLDIGCGDFRIGEKISYLSKSYTGIDVVPALIERNQSIFGRAGVNFACLDATRDELPDATLCLVRQVCQHLSNQQILSILVKLQKYKYILLTEHYPNLSPEFKPNIDKIHGADTRVYDNSAVVLDAPPYCLVPIELVLSVPASDYLVREGEEIRSYLFLGSTIASCFGTSVQSESQ